MTYSVCGSAICNQQSKQKRYVYGSNLGDWPVIEFNRLMDLVTESDSDEIICRLQMIVCCSSDHGKDCAKSVRMTSNQSPKKS